MRNANKSTYDDSEQQPPTITIHSRRHRSYQELNGEYHARDHQRRLRRQAQSPKAEEIKPDGKQDQHGQTRQEPEIRSHVVGMRIYPSQACIKDQDWKSVV